MYEGAATVMMPMPMPSMKRPTTNWATVVAVEIITIPALTTTPPANMPSRRQNLSARMAAKGAPVTGPDQGSTRYTKAKEERCCSWGYNLCLVLIRDRTVTSSKPPPNEQPPPREGEPQTSVTNIIHLNNLANSGQFIFETKPTNSSPEENPGIKEVGALVLGNSLQQRRIEP